MGQEYVGGSEREGERHVKDRWRERKRQAVRQRERDVKSFQTRFHFAIDLSLTLSPVTPPLHFSRCLIESAVAVWRHASAHMQADRCAETREPGSTAVMWHP